MKKVKLTNLQVENVKKVIAAEFSIEENGLTLIGGDNCQGKTTFLDAVAFLLGGKKYKPTNLKRDNAMAAPYIKATLNNGLTVERKGKNSELKVTDPSGQKSGQALLDSFVEEFALNIPKFIQLTNDKKVKELLRIIGCEEELMQLDNEETLAVESRKAIKIEADMKAKHAASLIHYDDAPAELVNASELLEKSGKILAKNAENQKLRNEVENLEILQKDAQSELQLAENEIKKAQDMKARALKNHSDLTDKLIEARKSAKDLHDESTEELQEQISHIDDTNARVRSNLDKEKAEDEANEMKVKVEEAEKEVAAIRERRMQLLNNSALPLEGLSIESLNGKQELTYNGKSWDCLSGMEQIKVATAIVKSLNEECGFILLDGLEAFDNKNLIELRTWLESCDMQAIGTRVGTGDECSIIIEAGEIKTQTPKQEKETW